MPKESKEDQRLITISHDMNTISLFNNENYGLFTKLLRIIVVCNFLLSLFKHKRGNLLPLTKYVFKLGRLLYPAIIYQLKNN